MPLEHQPWLGAVCQEASPSGLKSVDNAFCLWSHLKCDFSPRTRCGMLAEQTCFPSRVNLYSNQVPFLWEVTLMQLKQP